MLIVRTRFLHGAENRGSFLRVNVDGWSSERNALADEVQNGGLPGCFCFEGIRMPEY